MTHPPNRVVRDNFGAIRGGSKRPPLKQKPKPPGFGVRELAVLTISAIIDRGRALDDAFEVALASDRVGPIEPRDRAMARLIVLTVLRRKGELEAVLATYLAKPLPDDCGRLKSIHLAAAAQLLLLETPPHAAISLAVDQCRGDAQARRFDKLTNAVLRRVSETGKETLERLASPDLNIPAWLFKRWTKNFGPELAHDIAHGSLAEPPLDITVKTDPAKWAELFQGEALSTGTVRLHNATGRIEDLPYYGDGAWWIQDAAAALPAKLLGNVKGLAVADLCAAPGGKTAQLAAQGAVVTSVELSANRLRRVEENLERLKLKATLVAADVATWEPNQEFDAVLLDAPCTATGTIRRHPDIMHLKRDTDIAVLASVQWSLIHVAARLVKPGGLLIYCTCSLEPEEGAVQVEAFLRKNPSFTRVPIAPGEEGIDPEWISKAGDLRTLPSQGLDGFFAARLRRASPAPR